MQVRKVRKEKVFGFCGLYKVYNATVYRLYNHVLPSTISMKIDTIYRYHLLDRKEQSISRSWRYHFEFPFRLAEIQTVIRRDGVAKFRII